MRKDILIIDWILLFLAVFMILSKFIKIPFSQILQPIFLILIIIHIIQHWRFFVSSIKKLFRR